MSGVSAIARLSSCRRSVGFTLIELMITVVVIGILASIAVPSYMQYMERGKRAEGKAALEAAAQMMERSFSINNTYPSTLAAAGISGFTESRRYALAAPTAGPTGTLATSFVLSATPSGWTDPRCGTLTLSSTGVRGSSGTSSVSECWQR
ncbi:type IV pilin protein [Niveibacterium sp.]|uniref:type IV pilin protein n=1 Tax=Niveibacterium sp. TaxID=2017444 RepID=UPI0035ADE008